MAEFEIGARLEYTVEVTSELAINFLGPSGARVLATPRMIAWMEKTCRDLVFPMLPEGQDTVGTHVNVYHRKAASMGSTVQFSAEFTAVNRRRVQFNVRCIMGEAVIGDGTHERAIIDVAQFAKA